MNENDKLLKAIILFITIIIMMLAFIMTFISYKISEDVKNIRLDLVMLKGEVNSEMEKNNQGEKK